LKPDVARTIIKDRNANHVSLIYGIEGIESNPVIPLMFLTKIENTATCQAAVIKKLSHNNGTAFYHKTFIAWN
jgi:hypothetical protein